MSLVSCFYVETQFDLGPTLHQVAMSVFLFCDVSHLFRTALVHEFCH